MQGAKNHQGYRVQNLFTKAEYMAAMYLANQSKWCLAIGEGPYMGINHTKLTLKRDLNISRAARSLIVFQTVIFKSQATAMGFHDLPTQ